MELDDLRRQWQQPQPPGAAFDHVQLEALLKKRPGLVEKMRRNARVEMALTAGLLAAVCWYCFRAEKLIEIVGGYFLLLLGLGQLYYYYHKLGVLRRMATVEGHVRNHLHKLCTEMRGLLRFFYRVTLAAGPLGLFLGFCYGFGKQLARPDGVRLAYLFWEGGALLVFGALLQVAVVYGTRWYLQRLYGQHLDRLEASLRELSDEPAG